jgi:lipopolysaccharide export system protein LptA
VKTFRLLQAAKGTISAIEIVLLVLTLTLVSASAGPWDQPQETDANVDSRQIQIVADRLETNDAEKYAEFSGNVRASHGDLVILADRLKIYYRDDPDKIKNQGESQEMIKRAVASGNVKITTDKYTAETSRVEYDLDTMILVLDGQNSTVKSGKNILTGSKITVDRKDGQMKVYGSPEKRVKAVFYSKEKNLQKEPE